MERTKRSANAFMFGAWIDVRTILVPLLFKIALNRSEKSASRSTIKYRFPFRNPSTQSVRFRAIWAIQEEFGFTVVPAMCTLRVAISITNSVSCVTRPRIVQTSVVKKSAAAITAACDLMKTLQLDGRS